MKKIFVFLFLFLTVAEVFSQETRRVMLTGSVYDNVTGEKLPFANIVLFSAADTDMVSGTTSDRNGFYTIHATEKGNYLMQVSYIGYNTLTLPLTLEKDTTVFDISFAANQKMLTEVKVSAKKPIYAVDGEKDIYNVSQDPNIQSYRIEDALQNTPGIEVDAEGNITLRGTQAVEIWINGQPSNLSGESLKQYIKTMPASVVERIELITNPSARYSTSNSIVNIVQNRQNTHNDFLSMGANVSTLPHTSPWVSYMYQQKKMMLNIYAGYEYKKINTDFTGNSMLYSDTALSRSQLFSTQGKRVNNSGYVGFSLNMNFDTMNSLSVWSNFILTNDQSDNTSEYNRTEHIFAPGDYSFNQCYSSTEKMLNAQGGLWYTHKFDNKGRELVINGNTNIISFDGATSIKRLFLQQQSQDMIADQKPELKRNNSSFEIAYSFPYSSSGVVAAGVNASLKNQNMVLDWDTEVLRSGNSFRDSIRSKDIHSFNNTYSLFATVTQRIKRFSVKVGLRGEFNMINIEYSRTQTFDFDTNRFFLVPSIHLTYSTPQNHNFKLNYTCRYTAPSATQLSEYKNYDIDDFSTGNRNLLNSYAHNAELAWNKYFPNFGMVGVTAYFKGVSNSINAINDVIYDDLVFKTIVPYSQFYNIGSAYTTGVESNVTYMPSRIFTARLYANLYNYYYKLKFRDGWIDDQDINYSIRLNISATVWKTLNIYITGLYTSPLLEPLLNTEAVKSISLGANADFWKRKLSAYVAVNDVFDWNRNITNVTNPYYASTNDEKFSSRFISFGLTYRIGKMELERHAQQGNLISR